MNKKIATFLQGLGLKVEKNTASGQYRGYEVSALYVPLDTIYPLRILVACYATPENRKAVAEKLVPLTERFFGASFIEFGLFIGANDFTVNKMMAKLPDRLKAIFDCLESLQIPGSYYCPITGEEMREDNSKIINANGFQVRLSNDGLAKLNIRIEEGNKSYDEMPKRYHMGLLASFIGGLVGVAITIILSLFGFISAWSAIAAIAIASVLYSKFKAKPDVVMILMTVGIPLVMLLATTFITYVVVASRNFPMDNPFASFADAMAHNPQFVASFWIDMGLTLLFSLVGVIYHIIVQSKKVASQKRKTY